MPVGNEFATSLRPLIIYGPSGCGKTTLVQKLMNEFPNKLGFAVSHTSRAARPGEIHGKDYYFLEKEEMEKEMVKGMFIETAVFCENIYLTSFNSVELVAISGKVPILDIDIEGVKKVKQKLNPWGVFIQPSSLEDLRQNLIDRRTETEESLRLRLQRAKEDLAYGLTPGNFDLILTNDNWERTYKELRDLVVKNVFRELTNIVSYQKKYN